MNQQLSFSTFYAKAMEKIRTDIRFKHYNLWNKSPKHEWIKKILQNEFQSLTISWQWLWFTSHQIILHIFDDQTLNRAYKTTNKKPTIISHYYRYALSHKSIQVYSWNLKGLCKKWDWSSAFNLRYFSLHKIFPIRSNHLAKNEKTMLVK